MDRAGRVPTATALSNDLRGSLISRHLKNGGALCFPPQSKMRCSTRYRRIAMAAQKPAGFALAFLEANVPLGQYFCGGPGRPQLSRNSRSRAAKPEKKTFPGIILPVDPPGLIGVRRGAAPGRRRQASMTCWAFPSGTARIGAGAGRSRSTLTNAATPVGKSHATDSRNEQKGKHF